MKKIILAAVASAALAAPALAADLPQRTYAKAPVVVAPIYDWTGFYIGANGGWGSSRNCWGDWTFAVGTPAGCHNSTGGVLGGQFGYRWQAGQLVFGLEAQGDWANLTSSRASLQNPLNTIQTKVDSVGLFTGQLGYAWNAALLYVKGGAAVTNNRFDVYTTGTGVGLAAATSTRWGGVIGVGFEYGFTPNWTAGIEYDRLFMGSANNSFSTPAGVAYGLNKIGQDVDMVTLRLNYKFGGAVVARY